MKFVNKPCQGVVRKDRGNDRNQVRRHAKNAFDVCHCAGVIIQPNLSKQGVPSQADKKVATTRTQTARWWILYFISFLIIQRLEFRLQADSRARWSLV